ncbi:MAG: hypothetical protein A2136_03010 [Chloroflexi bacterium RBG_16_54_11]|nr:MAG: hypothetical protein A2136_03010 [Chloroflexi bacterium RBG_16_54_11]
MKRLFAHALILLLLAACSPSGNESCSEGGEVCIELHAIEPITYGEPVIVTITVTSHRDIPELGVSLYHEAGIVVEGPEGWEEGLLHPMVFTGGASWGVAIDENQTLVFTRTLHFPSRGYFTLVAAASTLVFRTDTLLGVHLTEQGGTVYYANTPIPYTPGPLPTTDPDTLATVRARPSPTPWPILTPFPTNTVEITSTPYPPPEIPPPDAPYP